jgi:hypothetical protein
MKSKIKIRPYVGAFCKLHNKKWKVFAIADSGLVTLKNLTAGSRPASMVVAPSSIDSIQPFIGVIKR